MLPKTSKDWAGEDFKDFLEENREVKVGDFKGHGELYGFFFSFKAHPGQAFSKAGYDTGKVRKEVALLTVKSARKIMDYFTEKGLWFAHFETGMVGEIRLKSWVESLLREKDSGPRDFLNLQDLKEIAQRSCPDKIIAIPQYASESIFKREGVLFLVLDKDLKIRSVCPDWNIAWKREQAEIQPRAKRVMTMEEKDAQI